MWTHVADTIIIMITVSRLVTAMAALETISSRARHHVKAKFTTFQTMTSQMPTSECQGRGRKESGKQVRNDLSGIFQKVAERQK